MPISAASWKPKARASRYNSIGRNTRVLYSRKAGAVLGSPPFACIVLTSQFGTDVAKTKRQPPDLSDSCLFCLTLCTLFCRARVRAPSAFAPRSISAPAQTSVPGFTAAPVFTAPASSVRMPLPAPEHAPARASVTAPASAAAPASRPPPPLRLPLLLLRLFPPLRLFSLRRSQCSAPVFASAPASASPSGVRCAGFRLTPAVSVRPPPPLRRFRPDSGSRLVPASARCADLHLPPRLSRLRLHSLPARFGCCRLSPPAASSAAAPATTLLPFRYRSSPDPVVCISRLPLPLRPRRLCACVHTAFRSLSASSRSRSSARVRTASPLAPACAMQSHLAHMVHMVT